MSSRWTGAVLVAGSIAVAIAFCVIADRRDLTGLENVLFQVFSLGVGLLGSYVYGRESAREAAREMVKPHARSAFRRLLSLYQSLLRLSAVIQVSRPAAPANPVHPGVLDTLEAMVNEQLAQAGDSLQDWKDIVPEEVAELEKKAAEKKP